MAQSAGALQLVLHAAPSHAYGAQLMVLGTHAPAPSQAERRFMTELPSGQLAGHAPLGSAAAGTKLHTPTLPAIVQDLQPPQAVSQQTPCAQWVLMHSASAAQASPFGVRLVHDPLWHVSPATQSPLPVQVVRQASPGPQR